MKQKPHRAKASAVTDNSQIKALEVQIKEFKYEEGFVIRDVFFDLGEGERIAITGSSGSGKSTLGKLIVGMSDEYTGTIKLNGREIKTIPLRELREEIGYFSNGIDPSVVLNRSVFSQAAEKLHNAMLAADIVNVRERFEKGEPISNFSDGEKQRLIIMLSLMHRSHIKIYDEMLSAIEKEQGIKIFHNIAKQNAGMLFITHQDWILEEVDKVIWMENGTVRDMGKHSQLVTENSGYKKYVRKMENDAHEEIHS